MLWSSLDLHLFTFVYIYIFFHIYIFTYMIFIYLSLYIYIYFFVYLFYISAEIGAKSTMSHPGPWPPAPPGMQKTGFKSMG